MNSLSRGVKNAFRNIIRTISITIILGLSIGLALTMLIARQAVTSKIDSVKSSIGNIIAISPAGNRGFEGGGEPLTNDQLGKVKATAHVVSVSATLSDRLTSTDTNLVSAIEAGSIGQRANRGFGGQGRGGAGGAGGTFTPPVVVTGINSTSSSQLPGGGTLNLTSGKVFDPSTNTNVAMVGQAVATKNNLSVGSTFQAYGSPVTVVGIYDAGNQFANAGIVMPLATIQALSSQPNAVSSMSVQVDSINNLQTTQDAIKASLGSAADVTNQQDTSAQAIAPLESIQSITMVSLVGAVAAGAVIILLAMLMIVRERRREIGVLKALGASQPKVISQFVVEAITLTLMGMVVGLVVGVLAASPITQLLVTNSSSATNTAQTPGAQMPGGGPGGGGARLGGAVASFAGQTGEGLRNIRAVVDWRILVYGLAAALAIAIVGSIVPAWLISRVRPAEVMRAE